MENKDLIIEIGRTPLTFTLCDIIKLKTLYPKRKESKSYINLEGIPEFKEGDWAFSLVGGWGKIVLIDHLSYPIILKCPEDQEYGHMKDGRYSREHLSRFLFTVSEAKLLFNLEPPKEKDELDIMLEKAIEFYGTDTLTRGIELLGIPGYRYTLEFNIDFKNKERFYINSAKQLVGYDYINQGRTPFTFTSPNSEIEFRPVILGYSNDKEPKPLVKGLEVNAVVPNGTQYECKIVGIKYWDKLRLFVSKEEAENYAKSVRKVQVEITEAEWESIKANRNS